MSGQLPVLEILRVIENDHADDALVEGLGRAEPDHLGDLVEALLARNTPGGLLGIIAHFHTLDDKLQSRILDQADVFFGSLRLAVKARQEKTRTNAVDLIGRIGNYRLTYLLSLTLRDSFVGIRQQSAEILRSLVDRYFRQERVTLEVLANKGDPGTDRISVQAYSLARLAEERSYLISTICESINEFQIHRRPEVAETVMWFAHHLNDTVWRAIANRLSACGRAVSELMETTTNPRTVPFFYEALCRRDLRRAATRVISERRDDAFMLAFMEEAFLIVDSRIRRGLSGIRHLAWLGRQGLPILKLDPRYYGQAVELVLATSIPVDRKVAVCRDLLLSGRPEAQRAGLWGLVGIRDDMSTQLIGTIVRWQDPVLSGIALREIMRRRPENLSTVLAVTATGDSPSLNEMVGDQVSKYDFDEYWQSYDVLDENDRVHLGKAVLRSGQDIPLFLRGKLVSPVSIDRLRAIQIISTLGLIGKLEEEIYRIAYDPDNFVRSAVMTLLGKLPGATSERILLNCLNDPDDRVQANGVESLEELRAVSRLQQVRDQLGSKDNRVRANAVKALLSTRAREAGVVLFEMLDHENSTQRASALWVIEALKIMTLAGRVLKIAKTDPDVNVRRRALQAVTILNNAMRQAPAKTTSPAEPKQEAVS